MDHSGAHEAARGILLREIAAADASSPTQAAAAAERAFQKVSANLARWMGPDGTHALFARALVLAQRECHLLRAVPPPTRSALLLDAVAATAAPHDTNAVTNATAIILTMLIELLGRLIGHDLAVTLVAEDWPRGDAAGTRRTADVEGDS